MGYGWGYPRQMTVAQRQAKAKREVAKLRKKGRKVDPVTIEGRTIARTFWGKSWCRNLEAYSDYANRLPRGRSYVRSGSVLDLQIESGRVTASVSGTRLYTVTLDISPLPEARWAAIVDRCGTEIDSVVELLQGKLSKGVMAVICKQGEGLFPTPTEIELSCSCPDWATMCKHVVATLYGVGARLDSAPELLFLLRGVDASELVRAAVDAVDAEPEIDDGDLSAIFGIELDAPEAAPTATRRRKAPKKVAKRPPPKRAQKPATKKSSPKTTGGRKSSAQFEVTPSGELIAAKELTAQGVSRARIQSWLRSGVLEHSGKRGIYRRTSRTAAALVTAPGRLVAAKEFTVLGVPQSRIQSWLRSGVLEHSGERGIYKATLRTAGALAKYVARG